jgi:hypothetical protein
MRKQQLIRCWQNQRKGQEIICRRIFELREPAHMWVVRRLVAIICGYRSLAEGDAPRT